MSAGEPPTVCVVSQPLSAAGEAVTGDLLRILSEITAVALVTPYLPEGSAIRNRYEVVELAAAGTGTGIVVPAFRFVLNQLRMARTVPRRDEEVVLFFGTTAYLVPIVAAAVAGKTVVLEPRGDVPLTLRLHWEQRAPKPVAWTLAGAVRCLERAGFWLADAIVTYTPGVADQLDLSRYEHKLYTDGARFVDTELFSPKVPFDERKSVVGFLGRLDEEKGIRTLVDVARSLPDDVTFRFIGDGALREWVEAELAAETAAGRVEVVGWVSHESVPDALSELRLLVLPSAATEGLPTAILEAFACGTPVYATPVSGVPDVMAEGRTGFIMESVEADPITADIEAIMARDDLHEVSENARGLVEAEYSFEAAVERYRRVLVEVGGRA